MAVRAAAHITGGGIPENLPRALPEGLRGGARHRARGSAAPAIDAVLATGRVAEDEAWSTFNMGLGMCVIVAPADVGARRSPRSPTRRRVGRVAAGPPGVVRG